MSKDIKDDIEDVIKKGKDIAEDGFEKAKEVAGNVKDKIVKTLDVDNDGNLDLDDLKIIANKVTKKGEELFNNITKKNKK